MQQEHSEGHHVVPVRTYLIIFGALMVLAVVTVAVSYVNLGVLNNFIALAIAISKAVLIMAFFMHLKYSNKLTLLVALMGFFWLIIFFAITMGDYLARGSIPGDLGPQSVFAPWM
ncbi:MAG: cytochrome C oxidase subunit IV family protein [Anaerolineae bacterium]